MKFLVLHQNNATIVLNISKEFHTKGFYKFLEMNKTLIPINIVIYYLKIC